MPVEIGLPDVFLRLGLAFLAGALVGFNRGKRNGAAGLRTTMLVCLAACVAAVMANLLIKTTGKDPGFFTQIDVMRLHLGILSGIGFIGAGAIIKNADIARGVTTAATIWFMTVVGLAFGTGFLLLGATATVAALVILWLLSWFDLHMRRSMRGALHADIDLEILPEQRLHEVIAAKGYSIVLWSPSYANQRLSLKALVQWSGPQSDSGRSPPLILELREMPGVHSIQWSPDAFD